MAKKKSTYYHQPSTYIEKTYLGFGHVDNYLKTIERNPSYDYLVKSIKELFNVLNHSEEMRLESDSLDQWGLPYKSHIIKYVDELILAIGLYPTVIGLTFDDYISSEEQGEVTIVLSDDNSLIGVDISGGVSRVPCDLKNSYAKKYYWYNHEYTWDEMLDNTTKRFGFSGLSITKTRASEMLPPRNGFNKFCNLTTPLEMLHDWFCEWQFGYNALFLGFNNNFLRIMTETAYPFHIKVSQLNGMADINKAMKSSERLHLSNAIRYQVLSRDKSTCQMCGRSVSDGVKLEIDHIIPVSRGGKTSLDNLQVLCYDCNRGKRDN